MGSLGETLRQARLDIGVSLQDVERETGIRRLYLEALESEDLTVLPAPVYVRGFIKVYSRFLGLDPEVMIDLYQPRSRREERPAIRPATPPLAVSRPVPVRLLLTLGAVALIGLALFYASSLYNAASESQRLEAERSQTRGQGVQGIPTAPAATRSAVSPAGGPAAGAGPSPTPARGIVVEARIVERTWLEVWVDGASALQDTLQAGTTRTFTGNESVRMRVANAAGVQVTVNGTSQGSLGARGQVVEAKWDR